jgi:hypothetical protein
VKATRLCLLFFFFFFWWDWGLNSGLCTYKSRCSPLQSICSGYFVDGGLKNYLPKLLYHQDPPDLILPSSYDYRHEPPVPRQLSISFTPIAQAP